MRIYSTVCPIQNETLFGYRYNYARCELEYVTRWDYRFEDGKLIDIILPAWRVVTSMGLSREEWRDNPEYWIEQSQHEINESVTRELAFL